jgi:hypothetical protein
MPPEMPNFVSMPVFIHTAQVGVSIRWIVFYTYFYRCFFNTPVHFSIVYFFSAGSKEIPYWDCKYVRLFLNLHCRKSWRNISFPSDISKLFHEDITTNISKNVLRNISWNVSKSNSNFSELLHYMIYYERFRDLAGRLSADIVVPFLFQNPKMSL